MEVPSRPVDEPRGILSHDTDRLAGSTLQLELDHGHHQEARSVGIPRTIPRTSAANFGRTTSATANTSACLISSVSPPVAELVIKLKPNTRMLICRATTTSGTVDMPTASAPSAWSRRN